MKIYKQLQSLQGVRSFSSFNAANLSVSQSTQLKNKPKDLTQTTDHMLTINWTKEDGWASPVIKPYGPIKIPTTATSLHYGVSCFDGFIVARNTETGQLQARDIDKHLDRMNRASSHIDLQEIDK